MGEAVDAIHLVRDLGPRGTDAELETAGREVVDRYGQLRQHHRVAVGVAGNQTTDADTFGRLGHRGLQRPALVDGLVGTVRTDGRQVVEVPEVVETRLFRDPPARAEPLDRERLAGRLEPEAEGVRHQWNLSVRTRMAYGYRRRNSSGRPPKPLV